MSKFEELRNGMSAEARQISHDLAQITLAREFAFERHEGQCYGTQPYTFHLNGVVQNVNRNFVLSKSRRDRCTIVAYLHDTLEDTDTTYEDLKTRFGQKIANDVHWLTKPKDMLYHMYIKQIIEHASAEVIIVKIADLQFNIKQSSESLKRDKRMKHMHEKYQLALMLLRKYTGENYEKRTMR